MEKAFFIFFTIHYRIIKCFKNFNFFKYKNKNDLV